MDSKYAYSTTAMLDPQYHSPDWIMVTVMDQVYDDVYVTTLATMAAGACCFAVVVLLPLVHCVRMLRADHLLRFPPGWTGYLIGAILCDVIVWFCFSIVIDNTVEDWAQRIMVQHI